MIGMNNNRNPIQGEFADKLREEIDNKVSEEDIKKMSENQIVLKNNQTK